MSNLLRFPHLVLVSGLFASTALHAQQDAAPIDLGQLLQALRGMKEQQVQQVKVKKQKALQDVQAAAASPAAAVAAWEEAVRLVQFEGATREGTSFKEWRDREGDGLKGKEAANAAQLHFKWMALTLQRSLGTPVKEMLPQVVAFTKEVAADQVAVEALEETIKRDKEQANSGKFGRDRKANDEQVKRMHDQIMRSPVNASVAATAMKITDLLSAEKWEFVAGNLDGIFSKVVLPELRAQKDPRILEFWDMRLKREVESAAKSKLAFDAEKFNQVRRPEILWSRAQDVLLLGQRNRAISEMFNLIKTYPAHPNADEWLASLEQIIAPATAPASAPATTTLTEPPPLAPPPLAPPPLAPPPAK